MAGMAGERGSRAEAEEGAPQPSRDTQVGWLLVGIQALLLVLLVLLPKRTGLGDVWPPTVPSVIGLVLMCCGLILAALSLLALGSALTPTPVPQEGAALRTAGVYGVVRHPIYVGVLIAAAGFTIAVGSWWQVLMLVLLAGFFIGKALWEDHLLAERHGVLWYDYADHVGGFLPRIRSTR